MNADTADFLREIGVRQNMTLSEVAGYVLNQYAAGERKIRFAAGTNISVNTIRRALMASPMSVSELGKATGFSIPTVRQCILRLEAAAEVKASLPGMSARAGRPFSVWSLTQVGLETCEKYKLSPLEGVNPSVPVDKGTPYERIKECFQLFPEKEWTVSDLINETKHSDITVRRAVFYLMESNTIDEAGKKATTGKPAITYRLSGNGAATDRREFATIDPIAEPVRIERPGIDCVFGPEDAEGEQGHWYGPELDLQEEELSRMLDEPEPKAV